MKAQIVSFRCVLRDQLGKVISSSFNRDVITCAHDEGPYLKGLVDGLQDLKDGEKRRINLTAKEAYGYYDPDLVMDMNRRDLAGGAALKVGDSLHSQFSDRKNGVYRVVAANSRSVTLDGNHPLAGQDLIFDIEATEARDANADDLTEDYLAIHVH